MNFKELRIGNWVEDEDDSHDRWRVEKIEPGKEETKGMWFVNSRWTEDLQPIPLTPEILEKAGLVKDKRSGVAMRTIAYSDESYPCTLQVSGGGKMLVCRSGMYSIGAPCEYLHQLQNLYFALTGEELNIEL
jgi:hypothetical protein